ncbi:MAG: helix-turn-helix domain-containing protein [Burkholderiales bacterium]|jgi:excisionase family DNA binding protein|nr:helix-turn-helix domain-containing protein [Burkholderiales bacterium]
MHKLAYSLPEAQELCGLGRTILYESIQRGELPIIKVGKRTLVSDEALRKFLKDREAVAPRAGK